MGQCRQYLQPHLAKWKAIPLETKSPLEVTKTLFPASAILKSQRTRSDQATSQCNGPAEFTGTPVYHTQKWYKYLRGENSARNSATVDRHCLLTIHVWNLLTEAMTIWVSEREREEGAQYVSNDDGPATQATEIAFPLIISFSLLVRLYCPNHGTKNSPGWAHMNSEQSGGSDPPSEPLIAAWSTDLQEEVRRLPIAARSKGSNRMIYQNDSR